MCTDCNEITIPLGPQGPIGPTGAAGVAGINGTNGTNGTNGSNGSNGSIILASYNSIVGISNPTPIGESSVFTHNLPANTLLNNGDELELYSFYSYSNNDSLLLRIKLGAKIHTINVANSESDSRILKIKISRISSISQLWTIEQIIHGPNLTNSATRISIDSSTVNLSTALAFEMTIENLAIGADQIVIKKATLYKNSI